MFSFIFTVRINSKSFLWAVYVVEETYIPIFRIRRMRATYLVRQQCTATI